MELRDMFNNPAITALETPSPIHLLTDLVNKASW